VIGSEGCYFLNNSMTTWRTGKYKVKVFYSAWFQWNAIVAGNSISPKLQVGQQ
jgi:hypothetical protein